MSMHVIFPGPCTTIQDGGRPGYQNSGFAPSGFIDRIASRMANALVDNDDAEAVLEFCLMGPTLTFDEDMRADRQTTGGYAKIAAIITLDIPRFAQLRPGQKVQFERCSVQEAQVNRPQTECFTVRLNPLDTHGAEPRS